MIPFSESAGEPASMQRIECAWCGKGLGAQVCVPSMAGTTSHGMCPECSARQRAALTKTLVPAERLEGAGLLTCGARADAGSPTLSLPGNKSLGSIEAASAPGQEQSRVKGTMTPGVQMPAVLEHLSHGPAASFTFGGNRAGMSYSATHAIVRKALVIPHWTTFWLVTGYDFKRSIAWAKRHGNPVADQIRDHKRRVS